MSSFDNVAYDVCEDKPVNAVTPVENVSCDELMRCSFSSGRAYSTYCTSSDSPRSENIHGFNQIYMNASLPFLGALPPVSLCFSTAAI